MAWLTRQMFLLGFIAGLALMSVLGLMFLAAEWHVSQSTKMYNAAALARTPINQTCITVSGAQWCTNAAVTAVPDPSTLKK